MVVRRVASRGLNSWALGGSSADFPALARMIGSTVWPRSSAPIGARAALASRAGRGHQTWTFRSPDLSNRRPKKSCSTVVYHVGCDLNRVVQTARLPAKLYCATGLSFPIPSSRLRESGEPLNYKSNRHLDMSISCDERADAHDPKSRASSSTEVPIITLKANRASTDEVCLGLTQMLLRSNLGDERIDRICHWPTAQPFAKPLSNFRPSWSAQGMAVNSPLPSASLA